MRGKRELHQVAQRANCEGQLISPAKGTQCLVVMGIDPSIAHLGIGVVDYSGPKPRTLHASTVNTKATDEMQARCAEIWAALNVAYVTYQPDVIVLEEPTNVQAGESKKGKRGGKSHKTPLFLQSVGMVRGFALAHAAPLIAVQPSQVKQAVGGTIRSTNEQMKWLVRAVCPGTPKILSEHAVHALACALYGARVEIGRRARNRGAQ